MVSGTGRSHLVSGFWLWIGSRSQDLVLTSKYTSEEQNAGNLTMAEFISYFVKVQNESHTCYAGAYITTFARNFHWVQFD